MMATQRMNFIPEMMW